MDPRISHFFISTHGHGNVVFNFRGRPINDLHAFSLGYHAAGKILAEKIASSNGYRDYDGYPILFLYRHALELRLKAIVYRGAQILGLTSDQEIDTVPLLTRHELSRFLPPMEAIFRAMRWKWDFEVSGLSSWDDFCTLVREIGRIDPQSYCFRYPINTTGGPSLPTHYVINVLAFSNNMDGVLGLLDGAITGLDVEWDNQAEAAYYVQEWLRDIRGEV